MAYNYKTGALVPFVQKFYKQMIIVVAGLFIASMAAMTLSASAAPTTFDFTAAELTNNWGPDRIMPSGGVTSVSGFQGRNNVAQIGIVSADVSQGDIYYRTEGIKTPKGATAEDFSVGGNFGQSVSVDLYLDSAWDTNAVRAGLWTVGDNGSGGTDATSYPFGIIEFANVAGYEGFRYFNPSIGYVNVPGFTGYGQWVTLNITLNPALDTYSYSINGTTVGTSVAPVLSQQLHSVILNQRNFGLDPQSGLTTNDYNVHWHGGLVAVDGQAPTVPTNLRADVPALACGSTTGSYNVTLGWNASTDDTAVTGYNYSVVTPLRTEATAYTTTVPTNQYSGAFTDGEGAYTFKVSAYDAAGNTSAWSTTCTIIYDNPATAELLVNKEQCKKGGWMLDDRGFKNQGDCVSFFATKQKNQPAGSTSSNVRVR